MKLFRRKSVKRIKTEIDRINKEMEKLNLDLGSDVFLFLDYNGMLKMAEFVLSLRDEL